MSAPAYTSAWELIERNRETKEPFLDLGNCGLTDESEKELLKLRELTHLKSLSLGTEYYDAEGKERNTDNKGPQNVFSTIPSVLPLSLEELQIRNAGITQITNIRELSGLKLLDLSLNQINRIENLDSLVNLEELALHGNQISVIQNIARLTKLRVLHLTRNNINKIDALENFPDLRELYLSANQIQEIENLASLESLELLDLANNQIDLVQHLQQLKNLYTLVLSYNNIRRIVSLDTPALTSLHLNGNQLTQIENLGSLPKLKTIDLSGNNISQIKGLEGCTNLTHLYIDRNVVGSLQGVRNFKALRHLSVSGNLIDSLDLLTGLPSLRYLDISGNQIIHIEPLTLLRPDVALRLADNPITDCPADIWQTNDLKQIKAYFEKQEDEMKKVAEVGKTELKVIEEVPVPDDSTKDVKLILLGNSNAGKTNLVYYLETGQFLQTRNSTHGLEVKRWRPDPARFPLLKNVTVSIWDFGGQEYYHEAYKLFLSANAVYAVVWEKETDCNFRRETLVTDQLKEQLEHFEKKYWMDTVRFHGDNKDTAPLLLIQNKVDNPEKDKQRISQELFDLYNLQETYHISLKEGCNPEKMQQVRTLQQFEKELEAVLAAAADKVETKQSWQIVRNEVVRLQENPDYKNNAFAGLLKEDTWIMLADFEKAAKDLVMARRMTLSENDLYTLPRWLDRSGSVVYFDKNDQLKDRIFISPKKLSERIYEVLNKEILQSHGEFSLDKVEGSAEFKKTFVEATRNLSLVFPHPSKTDHFIAPQYLPAEHAIEDLFSIASANAWQDAIWLKVPLFFYKKLLNHLVLHYVADEKTQARYYWKHGIVFLKNGIKVLIKGLYPQEDQQEGILLIGVEDKQEKQGMVREISKQVYAFESKDRVNKISNLMKEAMRPGSTPAWEIADINESDFKFLKNLELSYDNKSFIPYTILKQLIDNKESFYIHPETKERVSLHRFEPVLPFTSSIRPPKKVFISYSHQNTNWLNKLRVHLSVLKRSNLIAEWTDQQIQPGELWDKKIKENMEQADLFICLLSADFVASEYIWNVELKAVFEKLKQQSKRVVFVYVEPFDIGGLSGAKTNDEMTETSIHDFEIIPKNEKGHLVAASLWDNESQVMATIAKKIREVV